MTISTPRIDSPRLRPHPARRRGFTLTEVLVSAALSSLIMAGVLSAFLFIGRTGFSASSYSEMESQLRRALDTFAHDARMAGGITWNHAQSITLSVPTAGGLQHVTYAYDHGATGPTAGCFYRVLGGPDSTAPRRVLAREVAPDFNFTRYKLEQDGVTDNAALNDLETKLVQVNLRSVRTAVTAATTSQTGRSARFVLRNKRVTN
jgi:prepilin-type N-terminal cleavage/methylation domain-containing protein